MSCSYTRTRNAINTVNPRHRQRILQVPARSEGVFGNSTLSDLSGFFSEISPLLSEMIHSDRSECCSWTHCEYLIHAAHTTSYTINSTVRSHTIGSKLLVEIQCGAALNSDRRSSTLTSGPVCQQRQKTANRKWPTNVSVTVTQQNYRSTCTPTNWLIRYRLPALDK
jgi:hypothetical protein